MLSWTTAIYMTKKKKERWVFHSLMGKKGHRRSCPIKCRLKYHVSSSHLMTTKLRRISNWNKNNSEFDRIVKFEVKFKIWIRTNSTIKFSPKKSSFNQFYLYLALRCQKWRFWAKNTFLMSEIDLKNIFWLKTTINDQK